MAMVETRVVLRVPQSVVGASGVYVDAYGSSVERYVLVQKVSRYGLVAQWTERRSAKP